MPVLWAAKSPRAQIDIGFPVLSMVTRYCCPVPAATKRSTGITALGSAGLLSHSRVWAGILTRKIKIFCLVHALWQRGHPASPRTGRCMFPAMLHPLFHRTHLQNHHLHHLRALLSARDRTPGSCCLLVVSQRNLGELVLLLPSLSPSSSSTVWESQPAKPATLPGSHSPPSIHHGRNTQ